MTSPVPPVRLPDGRAVRGIAHPHPREEAYPHLLRTYDWLLAPGQMAWRPAVGVVLVLIGFIAVVPVALGVLILLPGALIEHGDVPYWDYLAKQSGLEVASPSAFLWLNLTLASAIPLSALAMRYLHRMRFGWLWSVVAGFRWKYFGACLLLSLVALGVSIGTSILLNADDQMSGDPAPFKGTLIAVAVVILLTTPLQAMGEEFAFRGYFMMAAGSFLGWLAQRLRIAEQRARTVGTWAAVISTALVFAAFHGAQNFPLFFDRFAFGLIAGILVVRTGGLEAGIALHILNNLMAFGLAIAFGDLMASLKVSEIPWSNIPVTIIQSGLYLVLADLVARRMGLTRRTTAWAAQTTAASA